MTERWTQSPKVAVVGGGLAGLAAGSALAESGFRVTLFERRAYLGGRASSYQHPGTGEVVDNCQHVLLGCCTNLIEFYQRIGVEDKIRWYERMTFLEPGGRASVIEPSALPAPLHTAPSFLRASCLNLPDKLSIAAGLAALTPIAPRDTGESFLQWLRRHGQTERAIDRFWKTVLVSALNEEIDLISVPYAAQVMRESFLKSRAAGRMGVPTVPLTELYNRAGDYMTARGGEVRFRASAESFRAEFADVKLLLPGGEESFDFVIPAVPFDVLSRMLPDTTAAEPLRQTLSRFRDFADHRHSSVVRSPDHRSRPCRTARPHHPVDVPQIEAAGNGRSQGSNGSRRPLRPTATLSWSSARRRLWSRNRGRKLSIWRWRNCASFFPGRGRPTW